MYQARVLYSSTYITNNQQLLRDYYARRRWHELSGGGGGASGRELRQRRWFARSLLRTLRLLLLLLADSVTRTFHVCASSSFSYTTSSHTRSQRETQRLDTYTRRRKIDDDYDNDEQQAPTTVASRPLLRQTFIYINIHIY